jgi:hypothetical protein
MGAGGRYGKSRVIESSGASLPLSAVMAGIVPAIHVFIGEGPQKDVDARGNGIKSGGRHRGGDATQSDLTGKKFSYRNVEMPSARPLLRRASRIALAKQEIAMNYTLLIYQPKSLTWPDAAAREAYTGGFMAYTKALQDAGVMVAGAGLQPTATATTLRMHNGKRQVQDGPYADTKEQLGGYYVINVPDVDTALDWAARIPAAPGSVIEVRPNLVPPG